MNYPIYNNNILKPSKPPVKRKNTINKNFNSNNSFNNILNKKINEQLEIKFSKHASTRMETRNINLNTEELRRINNGVKKAADKGVRDTLILMDKKAFVVSVKNKTVITAVNNDELTDNVFTNIDGAVIV